MRAGRFILGLAIGLPAFVLAANCTLIAVLGHIGRIGRLGPLPDIPNHFAPFWLAGSLVGLIVGLPFSPRYRRWISGMGLAGVIASGALILPEYVRFAGKPAPADAPGQIKVIQFNTWFHNTDPQAAVDWLVAEDPDFIITQETLPVTRELLAKTGRWHFTCPTCDETILSKLPPLPGDPHPVKPQPGLTYPEPVVRARFQDERGVFTVIGVHNGWPLGYMQRWQERRLNRVIGEDADRSRTIVAGDFNSAPWAYQRRYWDKAFGLIRRDRALFSWPAQRTKGVRSPVPFLPIDHIYAGPDWETVRAYRGPRLSSDHYPVVAILAPRARP